LSLIKYKGATAATSKKCHAFVAADLTSFGTEEKSHADNNMCE
jgi:hypothetical protein